MTYRKKVLESTNMTDYITSPTDIDPDKYYGLPHEVRLMEAQIGAIRDSRSELADHIEDAMSQSSETWHDNAPADALFGEMYQLDSRESGLIRASRNLIRLAYPTHDVEFATIGSRVLCSIAGSEFLLDLTGNIPLSGQGHRDDYDVERGSLVAPMPQSLLGAHENTTRSANINDRVIDIKVISIDQEAQQNEYGQA